MNSFKYIIRICGIFCLPILLLISGFCLAEDTAYHIGPRDIITITIYAGGEKQHQADLTVTAQGVINIPFIGAVHAKGLTTSELESRIVKPLAEDYFVEPEVNIFIREYHSLRYYIAGAVRSPGLYETNSKVTLMKLIANAGGVLQNRGNVAYILRNSTEQMEGGKKVENLFSDTEPERVDLMRLLDKGDMSYDKPLQTGDVVYIPPENSLDLAESSIYVEGEVRKPGVYNYQQGLTALNACIMAGGFGKFAAPNRTKIIRREGNKQIIIKIDLNDVKEGKTSDIELKPGDLINIPESWL